MPSADVLDFSALLALIPGDNPAGIDLRADSSPSSPYYAIKDARNAARAAERQLMMEGDDSAPPPDWRPVLRLASATLAEKTKDLEIVAYLIESLARLHAFAGLRDGFRLTRELVEQFWDGLYPLPDEEGVDTRVAPLTGLNGDDAEGTLINPITKISMTQGSSVGPFALFHYQQALALSQVHDPETREKRIHQGAVSLEMIAQAVAESDAPFFGNLVEDIQAAQEEFGKLGAVLEDKCGSRAPPTSNIRSTLAAVLEALNYVARDKLAVAMPAEETSAAADQADAGADGAPASRDGEARTREDAFRIISKMADFFRRTEPHTPVSYALDQVVRWGRMSLPELLAELIPDDNPRNQFFKQVGIRPAEAPPGG